MVHDDELVLRAETQSNLVPGEDVGVRGSGPEGVEEGKIAAL